VGMLVSILSAEGLGVGSALYGFLAAVVSIFCFKFCIACWTECCLDCWIPCWYGLCCKSCC
jgi:hypothetical protein